MSLKDEFAKLQSEALAIVEKAKSENRGMSDDEKKDFSQRKNRLGEIKSLLSDEKEIKSLAIESEDDEKKAALAAIQNFNKEQKQMDKVEMSKELSVLESVREFARSGKREFALTSGTDYSVLMPRSIPQFYNVRATANAFRQGFALLGKPTLVSSVTDDMTIPTLDDSANEANDDQEGATSGASADASTGDIDLDLVEYHSQAAWLSKKVVNAHDFDVTQYILPQLLNRIERKEEENWADLVIADTTIVGKTTASTTAVTLPELIDWHESVDAAYDAMPKFIVGTKALRTAIRKLTEGTTNRPFFGVENGLATLFDIPFLVCPSLEAMTAGKVVGAIVCTDGTVIRDTVHNELVRYEKESGHPGSVGFEAFGWSAFGYGAKSIKTLKMASA